MNARHEADRAPTTIGGPPLARRLLFVSSIIGGGSGRSQRELADALRGRGRFVSFLVDGGDPMPVRRRLLEECTDASVRFHDSRLAGPIEFARRRVGANPKVREIDGLRHESTIAPENAFAQVAEAVRPDVVIASSIGRVSWRRIRDLCRRAGIPTVLYLREATAIEHLESGLDADLLLANSQSLANEAGRLGRHAELVPSLVRVPMMELPPTGAVLLLVNPLATHGIHVIGPLAASRPDIPIVLQQSWPIEGADRKELERLIDAHPNVSLRPFDPEPGHLFHDARALLAPHQIDNRPRTVLEAQANGLPVIASDHPGLAEAVGDGGILVDPAAGPEQWLRAVSEVWDDERLHMNLADRARIHAGRHEVRVDRVVERFEELVDALVR